MKRSLPADFDPVYPYLQPPLNIMPPFYSEQGFVQAPTSVLSLKTSPPFTYDKNGSLVLKLGGGLVVNQDGALQAASSVASVRPPLLNSSGTIILQSSDGLTVEDGKLKVALQAPLKFYDGALALPLSEPFVTSPNGDVSLNVGKGLQINNSALSLAVGHGFSTQSNVLELLTTSPLTTSTGTLSLATDSYFTTTNNSLGLSLGSGIYINNNQLAVKYGRGLFLNSQTNNLDVNIAAPLNYNANSGSIELVIGGGLEVSGSSLGSQLRLKVGGMFNISDGTLRLNHSGGIINNNGQLQVSLAAPLNLINGAVGLQIGNGLALTGSTLGSSVYVKAGPGLSADANNVRANLGSGLQIVDSRIETKLGTGLTFDSNQAMTLNVGDGLILNSNRLQVNIGSGLTFSNGALTLSSTLPTSYTDYTLWTTPDPSPNATIGAELNAKVVLSLSKAGSTVIGTIGVVAVKAPLTSIAETAINVEIYFDSAGNIDHNRSTIKSYWGFRQGNSFNPSSPLDPLYLMPNQAAYPPGRKTITQMFPLDVYLNGDTSKPVPLEVAFNTLSETGYSLEFTWRNLNSYTGQPFNVSLGSFSYITQQ